MALQVVSPAVSVFKVTGVDKDTHQEISEEHVYHRGEILPDWVSPFQLFTLTTTGMAREVGDMLDPNLVADADRPAPVVLPEHNPATIPGSGVQGPMLVTERVDRDGERAEADVQPLDELPADSDTKPKWEEAGVKLGLSRNRVESMRKGDLMDEVKQRQAAAEERRDLGGPDAELPPTRA